MRWGGGAPASAVLLAFVVTVIRKRPLEMTRPDMAGDLTQAIGQAVLTRFVLLKANIDLFVEYGLMVIGDGALEQLVDLLGSAYLSMAFYTLFKVCERILVERLTAKRFGPKRARPR